MSKLSDDAAKKRIQALGVNFYLDGSGKVDRSFGVRYPASAEPPASRPADASPEESGSARRRSASPDDIQVLGRDAEGGGRMKVSLVRPLAAAMAEKDGALVRDPDQEMVPGSSRFSARVTGAAGNQAFVETVRSRWLAIRR